MTTTVSRAFQLAGAAMTAAEQAERLVVAAFPDLSQTAQDTRADLVSSWALRRWATGHTTLHNADDDHAAAMTREVLATIVAKHGPRAVRDLARMCPCGHPHDNHDTDGECAVCHAMCDPEVVHGVEVPA